MLIIFTGFMLSSCGIARTSTAVYSPSPDDDSEAIIAPGSVIQEGLASWYGPKFHGRPTANGEVYDMDALTAAHRTLPFNTQVRVTNQANGKTVDVRINDRGPYIGDRIIDLSRGAAREVDMINDGLGEVSLQLLEVGDRQITATNSSSRESFTVQLASFDREQRAQQEAEKISGSEVVAVPLGGITTYRVYYGNYSNTDDAETARQELEREGHTGFVKQREN